MSMILILILISTGVTPRIVWRDHDHDHEQDQDLLRGAH